MNTPVDNIIEKINSPQMIAKKSEKPADGIYTNLANDLKVQKIEQMDKQRAQYGSNLDFYPNTGPLDSENNQEEMNHKI